MKTSFTILFYLCSTLLLAQNQAATNRAELLLCSKNFEAAGNLYDSLLQESKPLLSQDFFNAAMCHIHNQNVASSKSYIQKLALRGVPFTEVEPLKKYFSPTEWQNIEISYQQLVEVSIQDNVFTQFQEEMEEHLQELYRLRNKVFVKNQLKIYSDEDSLFFVYDEKILRKLKESEYQTTYKELEDSISALPENKAAFQFLVEMQNSFLRDFVEFIEVNGFPSELQLNGNRLNFLNQPFWNLSNRTAAFLDYKSEDYYSRQIDNITLNALPDSLAKTYLQILEQKLTEAVEQGKIKARQQLKLLYPREYQNLSNINALLVFTEKGTCNFDPTKAIFYYRHQNLYKSIPNLESQDDFGRKFMFQVEHPDLFYFMETINPEHAYFDSCQAAKEYLESKKLVN